jgi:hypothetical protein
MITLREAASGLLSAVESAIESGDWKVDGACDPTVEIIRLKNILAKPLSEWQGLTTEDKWNILQSDFGGSRADCMDAAALLLKVKNNGNN